MVKNENDLIKKTNLNKMCCLKGRGLNLYKNILFQIGYFYRVYVVLIRESLDSFNQFEVESRFGGELFILVMFILYFCMFLKLRVLK